MALVFVTVAVCCVATVGNNSDMPVAAAETQISNKFFHITYSTQGIELLINGNYNDYKGISTSDVKEFGSKVVSAIRDIIANGILNANGGISMAMDLPEGFDPGTVDPSTFDWNSSELMSQFKDYVTDRLGTADEFQKYIDGEYDILIDYAIGSYIESKKDEIEDIQTEYDKIQSAIQEVVDEAYESAVEDAKNELGDYFDETEWEAKKEQASNKVVERVENVQVNGGTPSISIKQLIGAVKEISINGNALYSSIDGLRLSGVKAILAELPLPGKFAEMSSVELESLIDWNITVDTTFGALNFGVKFGLFGDVSAIQTLARKVANNLSVSVNGSNVAVEMNVPEIFSKALKKFYNSSNFTDSQKEIIFDLFDKSLSEVELQNAIDFLKDVDYKYWLSNIYNAEYMNYYFGSYAAKLIGHEFTDTTIDSLITKLYNFVVPKIERVENISLDSVKNWLVENVPGASRITESATLNNLAERLLDIINRIDWAKYDAEYIREAILGDQIDINGKIVSYLDRFENSERFYDTAVRYYERVIELLPNAATNKSVLDLFDGDNFVIDCDYTVDFGNIFSRVANLIRRYGFESVAGYVENASLLLDKSELNIGLYANINVPALNRVDYEVKGEIVSSGLLPEGVNADAITKLARLDSVDGYDILYWTIKGENDEIVAMPNGNIVLVPVYDFSASIDGDIDVVYEDNTVHTLYAVVNGFEGSEYSYAWYKDGELLDNTSDSISVSVVADSGVYGLVVTDINSGVSVKCDDVNVSIAPKMFVSPVAWDKNYSFVYGKNVVVSYDGIVKENKYAYTDVVYTYMQGENVIDIEGYEWNVGNYTVSASFELNNANYASADGQRSWIVSANIAITPKIVSAPNEWTAQYRAIFGNSINVEYKGISASVKYAYTDIEYTYKQGENVIDISADDFVWNVGNYTVTASFGLNSDNYATAEGQRNWDYTVDIVVSPKTLALGDAKWVAPDAPVYDGQAKEVKLSLDDVDLSDAEKAYVLSCISYKVNDEACESLSFVNAGTYAIKAEIVGTNDNYKIVPPTLVHVLTIQKAEANVNVNWNYSDAIEYDGNAHELNIIVSVKSGEINLPESDYTYTISGVKSAKESGEYNTVVLVTLNNNNYKLSGSPASLKWQIAPKEIDAPAKWTAEYVFVYGEKISVNYSVDSNYFTAVQYSYYNGNDKIDNLANLDVGEYSVKAKFSLKSKNYVVKGSDDREWELINTIIVNPKVLDLAKAEWICPENNVYGSKKIINLDLSKTELTQAEKSLVLNGLSYSVNGKETNLPIELIEVGKYNISASYVNGNYSLKNIPSVEYEIVKAPVNVVVNWDYKSQLNYTGSEQSVKASVKVLFKGVELSADDYTVSNSGTFKAIDAGTYKAVVEVTLKNNNYVIEGESKFELSWVIVAKAPSQQGEGSKFDGEDGIKLEIISGSLPADYVLSSKLVDLTEEQIAKIKEMFSDKQVNIISSYDIHFEDGSKVERKADGTFKVTLPLPEEYRDLGEDSIAIAHIKDDGSIEIITATIVGENVEFTTNGFSIFSTLELKDLEEKDNWPLIVVIIVLSVLLIVCIIVIVILALRKKNKPTDDNPEDDNNEPVEDAPQENAEEVTADTVDEAEEAPVEEEHVEEVPEEVVEEPVEEEQIEEVVEEAVEEPVEEPIEDVVEESEPVEETVEEEESEDSSEPENVDIDVNIGLGLDADAVAIDAEPLMVEMLDRSFTARLSQADDALKANYNEIKNFALSFKGVNSRISWSYDSINRGRRKVCKIVVKGKSLILYLALNPYELPEKYHHKSVNDVSKYAQTPTKLKVRSGRSVKYAKELIAMIASNYDLKQREVENNNYAPEMLSDDELKAQGYIKTKLVKDNGSNPWGNR